MTNETTQLVGDEAYNDFQVFSTLSYNCIKYLRDNNETVWKLLKYTGPDAWEKDNLTLEEKSALIYAGQADSSKYYLFMDSKQPDVMMEEKALVRISPYYAVGFNRTIGLIQVSMEIFSHYKINHLTNYKTRIDMIVEELLTTFNGANVGGLGLMSFNNAVDESSRLFEAGQIPFGGKQVLFSIFSA